MPGDCPTTWEERGSGALTVTLALTVAPAPTPAAAPAPALTCCSDVVAARSSEGVFARSIPINASSPFCALSLRGLPPDVRVGRGCRGGGVERAAGGARRTRVGESRKERAGATRVEGV
eukprot:scaffold125815_cov45-Phaeocystis_antarctica.AAC.2